MANRICSYCHRSYTDEEGHDYDQCVKDIENALQVCRRHEKELCLAYDQAKETAQSLVAQDVRPQRVTAMNTTPPPGTSALLAQAKSLLEASAKATPGPWEYGAGYYGWDRGIFPAGATDKLNQAVISNNGHVNGEASPEDAAFIVLARTAGPALARGLLEALARIQAYEQALNRTIGAGDAVPKVVVRKELNA